MSNNKPEAMRLADHLERFRSFPDDLAAAAELRRQHELIVEMRDALEKAMPMLALLVLAGSSESDAMGVRIGKLIAKAEGQQ